MGTVWEGEKIMLKASLAIRREKQRRQAAGEPPLPTFLDTFDELLSLRNWLAGAAVS